MKAIFLKLTMIMEYHIKTKALKTNYLYMPPESVLFALLGQISQTTTSNTSFELLFIPFLHC